MPLDRSQITHWIDWPDLIAVDRDGLELPRRNHTETPETAQEIDAATEARVAIEARRVEREEPPEQAEATRRQSELVRTAHASRHGGIYERRLRVARLLLERGVMRRQDIGAALNMDTNTTHSTVRQHPWFRRVGFWSVALTEEGIAAVAAQQQEAS